MVNIFDFTNFKEYLKAYYEEQRGLHPEYFSYQWLANSAGFTNRGFMHCNSIFPEARSVPKPLVSR